MHLSHLLRDFLNVSQKFLVLREGNGDDLFAFECDCKTTGQIMFACILEFVNLYVVLEGVAGTIIASSVKGVGDCVVSFNDDDWCSIFTQVVSDG